jgi:glutamate formiminotransferase
MLTAVVNISEGRRQDVLEELRLACGPHLLDVHTDADHHRSVFTLGGPQAVGAERGAHELALAASTLLDVTDHAGVHPRFGAIDVVPFVSIERDGASRARAVGAARRFAVWADRALALPSFLYGEADPLGRSLPEVRRDAYRRRFPDFGPKRPHPTLGSVAVGARAPMIAVNCELATDDLDLARDVARTVRAANDGLPGVRALGFRLKSVGRVQVSMNLVALDETGLEAACTAVSDEARARGTEIQRIELVGLSPAAELERTSPEFREWAGLDESFTVEYRLRANGADLPEE